MLPHLKFCNDFGLQCYIVLSLAMNETLIEAISLETLCLYHWCWFILWMPRQIETVLETLLKKCFPFVTVSLDVYVWKLMTFHFLFDCIRCFGMLLSPGQKVRNSDMHLLDMVRKHPGFFPHLFCVSQQWYIVAVSQRLYYKSHMGILA